MLKNMATSLLRHETIRTTVEKAKELRRVVEPLITLGKDDTQAHRRLAFARLRDAEIVEKLFGDLGPRFKTRPGGYTRILRMMPRPGDNADMALMQLVELAAPVTAETAAPADDGKARNKDNDKKAAKRAKAEAAEAAKAAKAAKPVKERTAAKKKAADKDEKAEKPAKKAASKEDGAKQTKKKAAKKSRD